jgi:hypothetical protein
MLPGCSDQPVTVKLEGRTVENLREAETLADRRFHSDATIEGATIGSSARCFFSREKKSGDTLRKSVFCGPVRHFGETEPTLWDSYALAHQAGSRPSAFRVYVDGEPAQNVPPPDESTLFRFDGRHPAERSPLSAPGLPRLPASYASVQTSDPEVALRQVAADVQLGSRSGIRISGLGQVDQLNTEDGQRRAPNGARLIVARLEAYGDREPVSLSMDIDGRHSELGDLSDHREGWVIAALPAGAGRAELSVVRQSFHGVVSMMTGSLVSAEPTPTPIAAAQLEAIFPREEARADFGAVQATASLSGYAVTAARLTAVSEWFGFPEKNKAWLSIHFDSLPRPSVYSVSFNAPRLNSQAVVLDIEKSFKFVLVTGESVSAVDVGKPDTGPIAGLQGPAGHEVLFAVPGDTRAGTLRVTPTFSLSTMVGQATATTSIGFTPRDVPLTLT